MQSTNSLELFDFVACQQFTICIKKQYNQANTCSASNNNLGRSVNSHQCNKRPTMTKLCSIPSMGTGLRTFAATHIEAQRDTVKSDNQLCGYNNLLLKNTRSTSKCPSNLTKLAFQSSMRQHSTEGSSSMIAQYDILARRKSQALGKLYLEMYNSLQTILPLVHSSKHGHYRRKMSK